MPGPAKGYRHKTQTKWSSAQRKGLTSSGNPSVTSLFPPGKDAPGSSKEMPGDQTYCWLPHSRCMNQENPRSMPLSRTALTKLGAGGAGGTSAPYLGVGPLQPHLGLPVQPLGPLVMSGEPSPKQLPVWLRKALVPLQPSLQDCP